MQKTLQLFIGSNNTTRKVEVNKLKTVLDKYHDGWTMQNAIGSWLGIEEQSVTVIINDELSTIKNTMLVLKQVLKQDAIAYHEVTPLEFI